MEYFYNKTHSSGDQTVWYDVEFNGNVNLNQFIEYILSAHNKEWGHFTRVYSKMKGWYEDENFISDYKNGYFNKTKLYHELENKNIKKITANGGWGNIDYYIEFE